MESDTALIYHFWTKTPHNIWENLRYPIIHAIAILRGSNTNIKIYILDISDHINNYGLFPETLNFKVIHWKSKIPRVSSYISYFYASFDVPRVSRLINPAHCFCASIFDIPKFAESIPEKIIICSDVDIFWVNDPLPLRSNVNKLCCHPENTGLWYYNKESSDAMTFLAAWQKMILLIYQDISIRYNVLRHNVHYNFEFWTEESVLIYMLETMPEIKKFFDPIDLIDNYYDWDYFESIPANIRGLHFCVQPNRGKWIYLISEFYDLAAKALTPELLSLLVKSKPRKLLRTITGSRVQ